MTAASAVVCRRRSLPRLSALRSSLSALSVSVAVALLIFLTENPAVPTAHAASPAGTTSSFDPCQSPDDPCWPAAGALRWRGGGPAAGTVAVPYGGTAEDDEDDVEEVAASPGAGGGYSGRRWGQPQPPQRHPPQQQQQRQAQSQHDGHQWGEHRQPQWHQNQRPEDEAVWRRPEEEHEAWHPAESSSDAEDPPSSSSTYRSPHGGPLPVSRVAFSASSSSSSYAAAAAAGSRSHRRRRRPPAGVDAETASLALRLTCETNRRLRLGTSDAGRRRCHSRGRRGRRIRPASASASSGASSGALFLHDETFEEEEWEGSDDESAGKEVAVLSHRPVAFASPAARIRRMTPEERRGASAEELTVFHAAARAAAARGKLSPERQAARGGRGGGAPPLGRWGPDLDAFLESLCESLGCSSDDDSGPGAAGSSSLVLALAMIYLDRACSVETDRTSPYLLGPNARFAPCPYLTPRTVHRSALTAVVLACRALRGETDFSDASVTRRYAEALSGVGRRPSPSSSSSANEFGVDVTEEELGSMERHMLGALGAGGLGVEADKLEAFLEAWAATFFPGGEDEDEERERVSDDRSNGQMTHRRRAEEGHERDAAQGVEQGQPFPGDWAQQQYQ